MRTFHGGLGRMVAGMLAAGVLAGPWPLAGSASGQTELAPDATRLPQRLRGDRSVLIDPGRPVSQADPRRGTFTVEYFTQTPCESRVQVREGGHPFASGAMRGDRSDPWAATGGIRVVQGEPGKRTWHRVEIADAKPGTRYWYRVFDPGATPTSEERRWGAAAPWRREFAFSTQAPAGKKTIVRYPVKVLLMPNVVQTSSLTATPANPPTRPSRLTDAQLEMVKEEIDAASLFFFVNSHMRLWVDFQVFVDDRWQRWGEEPAAGTDVEEFFRGMPACRSWAGVDYRSPGGGEFTILDTTDPLKQGTAPVVEASPFYGQVEIAFPQRWDGNAREWVYATSGGGTLGVDSVPDGLPARSQYLGGYDTAWLTTHEVHHQLESLGACSLAQREDDRIVFNHWAPRSRTRSPDAASGPAGEARPHPWTTSDRHGEHYDGMAFWDRSLTDLQWLRLYLTEIVLVADADGDGFPDDDPRLPLDEKRFGSRSDSPSTGGSCQDLFKAMLSTWAPSPLQVSFNKPRQVFLRPNPTGPDSDNDGLPDGWDENPLTGSPAMVWPMSATIDGDPREWEAVRDVGTLDTSDAAYDPPARVTFKHAHNERFYSGLLELEGEWARVRVTIDGEGRGVYSGEGVQALNFYNSEPVRFDPRDRFFPAVPGLAWSAGRPSDGKTIIEFALPNRPEGEPREMFWRGGGREVGVCVELWDAQGRGWSMFEPYRPFYCRMLEGHGAEPMPSTAPKELDESGEGVVALKIGDAALATGGGWRVSDGALRHTGPGEDAIVISLPEPSLAFDLWVSVEAKSDVILSAVLPGTRRPAATRDYVAFIGGYSNTRSRLRLFGQEMGDTDAVVDPVSPARHTMQLSRRDGVVWCLWNGKVALWARDPQPEARVDRLAILGGYGGAQAVHQVRYRVAE